MRLSMSTKGNSEAARDETISVVKHTGMKNFYCHKNVCIAAVNVESVRVDARVCFHYILPPYGDVKGHVNHCGVNSSKTA